MLEDLLMPWHALPQTGVHIRLLGQALCGWSQPRCVGVLQTLPQS